MSNDNQKILLPDVIEKIMNNPRQDTNLLTNKLVDDGKTENTPIVFTQTPDSKKVECIGSKADTGCTTPKEETDIIYVPEQNKFWIVTQSVMDELEESADNLSSQLKASAGNEPSAKAKRMQALQKSGLMEFFKTPDLTSFLDEEEKKQLQQLQNELKYGDEATLQAFIQDSSSIEIVNVAYRTATTIINYGDAKLINNQINKLIAAASTRAREKGYIVDNGELYTPEQQRVRELLAEYLKRREYAGRYEKFREEDGEVADVFDEVDRVYRKLKNEGRKDFWIMRTPEYIYRVLAAEQYAGTILELANYGIAVPEYALAKKDEILKAGMQRYFFYRNNLKEIANVKKALNKEFEVWIEKLHVGPPRDTFAPHLDKIAALQKRLDNAKKQAEENVANFDDPKILIWEPEFKHIPSASTLIADSMPLREYVKPKPKVKVFKQFTVNDLLSKTQKALGTAKHYYENSTEGKKDSKVLGKLKYSIKDLNNKKDVFHDYLAETKAVAIEIKKEWYDQGIFQPERFYQYLDSHNYKIDSLKDPAERKRWGELLQAIILEDQIKRKVTTFDDSAGAMLLRAIGSGYDKLKAKKVNPKIAAIYDNLPTLEFAASFEAEGPTFSAPGVEAKANLGVALFHGRVKLTEIYSPPKKDGKIQPLHVEIDYLNWLGEQKTLDFGHFFLKTIAEGTGFAGAALMLSASASLLADQQGLTIKANDRYEQQGINTMGTGMSVQGSLFAGISLGVVGTSSINWCPPKNVVNEFDSYYAQTNVNDVNSYSLLTQLKVASSVLVGYGIMGSFSIGMVNKRIRVGLGYGISAKLGIQRSTTFDLDMGSAYQILTIICRAVRENDYMPVSFVTSDAMNFFAKLAIVGASALAYACALSTEVIEKLYKTFVSGERSGLIAYHMVSQVDKFAIWLKDLPPQTLGALLHILTQRPDSFDVDKGTNGTEVVSKYQCLVNQQEAIVMCLNEIERRNTAGETFDKDIPSTAQTIFEEVIMRLDSSEGVFPTDRASWIKDQVEQDAKLLDNYCANLDKLNALMNREPATLFGNDKQKLDDRHRFALKRYNVHIANLNLRMQSGCKLPGDYFDKFLTGRALRLERLRAKRPISDGKA